NVIDSDSFKKHHQNLMDFSNSKSINSLNDEGRKFSSGLTQSLDTVNSAQVQHQDALSKLQQVSDNWSFTQTMSAQQRTALDQEFVDWLSNDKYANDGGFGKARDTILRGRQEEIDSLGQEFLSTKLHDIEKPSFSPEDTFNESSAAFLSEKQRIQDSFHFNDELVSKGNSLSTKFHDRKEEYSFLANDPFEGVNTTIQGAHERISGAQQVQSSNWENKHREYEFYSEAKKIRNYAGNAVRIVGNAAEGLIEEPVEGRRAGPFAIPPSLWHKNTEAMH
ncbi:MAG: hypothetical protein ACE5GN_07815, partial [Waddliaceae bacterium]